MAVNMAMAERFNLSQEELQGKKYRDVMPLSLARERVKQGKLALERGKLTIFEDEREGRYFRNYYLPISVSSERNTFQVISRDFTERKQAEEALRKSEEQYREYFEENLAGAYITTPDGQLVDCNQEYLKIFGFKSKQEAIQMPLTDVYENKDKRTDLINKLTRHQHVKNREVRQKRLDGTLVTVVENASGLFDKDGNLTHIRGFLLDISEQKRLEAQLQQTQKMESIGTLAGGIAHDFNNILFPIVGHTEMLLEDVPEDSPFRKDLDRIYTSALRAKDLVKQILTFSRQGSNEPTLMKIQPIIKEALKLIRSTIPATIDIKLLSQQSVGF